MFFFQKKKIIKGEINNLEILGLKKYREIEILLKKFPLNSRFIEEVQKTKKECENIFDSYINMSQKDWNILTLIRLFDRSTFEHSVGSFLIVKEKIENFSDDVFSIKKSIIKEVGNMDVFYRACLFHDIGKIAVPKFILANSLTDKDWALNFYKGIKKQKYKLCFTTKRYLKKYNIFHYANKIVASKNAEEILNILKENNLRPVNIFPLKYGIGKKELGRLKKDYGLEGDLSLTDLIKIHEEESYNILNNLGYRKEAQIAGNHGNDKNSNFDNNFYSNISLKIGSRLSKIIDLIHLADVQDALENRRYYHKEFTKLKIVSILAQDAQKGIVDENLACFWVSDELEKIKQNKEFFEKFEKIKKENIKLNKEEEDMKRDLKIINNFILSISCEKVKK